MYSFLEDMFKSCRRIHIVILFVGIAFLCVITSESVLAETVNIKAKDQSLIFGVFPYLPASRLEEVFSPLAAEIGQALDRRIHYRSASTFERFMNRLTNAEFDIAFIQPFDYIRIASKMGYLPVVKRTEQLYAVFVVKEESSFARLLDLKGTTIAMAPEVAALSYLGKAALIEAGLDLKRDIKINHMKGHHSCLQQVVIGNASACVTGMPALRVFEANMAVKLKTMWRTSSIPQMLFVVHKRIPKNVREEIKVILLSTTLSGVSPEQRTLLMKGDVNPFIEATDKEYDVVRTLWKAMGASQ